MKFGGTYADRKHPGCPRKISLTSPTELTIVGHDGIAARIWKCVGTAQGDKIFANLSNMGGPEKAEGRWTGSGICWEKENGVLIQNNGDSDWYKDDAVNFAGTYSDLSHPGCPRIIEFSSADRVVVTGHDGDPLKKWTCVGTTAGTTIRVNFSDKGGSTDLEGKWTGTGICWVKDTGVPIKGASGDNWCKDEAMNFEGNYIDMKNPTFPRCVRFTSESELIVSGHDGDPSQSWAHQGVAKGRTITVNMAGKELEGEWTGTGICVVRRDGVATFSDVDTWRKVQAIDFSGTYADCSHPGCPRLVTHTSEFAVAIDGHDGDPSRPWKGGGYASGNQIFVDLPRNGVHAELQGHD
jgi:hypothetical protein